MFELAPQYYSPIYFIAVAILSLFVFMQYENYTNDRMTDAQDQHGLGVFLFALLMAFFIGMRPLSGWYFVDMENYDEVYSVIRGHDYVYKPGAGSNIIFDNLLGLMASNGIPSKYFFLTIAIVYFVCLAYACTLFFPKDKMASFLVYLSAFSTFSYSTNGIKAGMAASIFLVALALYERRKWIGVVLLMLVCLGVHHAMILPVAAFVGCNIVKNPKIYLGFWVVCFFLSLFHVTFFQELFANLVNEHGAEYLLGNGGYVKAEVLGGFRIDFILYSAVPMVVGLIAIEKKKIESEKYVFLLNLYTLINAVWLLCMYADYTNRISYLSWMLYPIVLIYPFLNEEWEGPKYKVFQWVAYGHLLFNLFMIFIYW